MVQSGGLRQLKLSLLAVSMVVERGFQQARVPSIGFQSMRALTAKGGAFCCSLISISAKYCESTLRPSADVSHSAYAGAAGRATAAPRCRAGAKRRTVVAGVKRCM